MKFNHICNLKVVLNQGQIMNIRLISGYYQKQLMWNVRKWLELGIVAKMTGINISKLGVNMDNKLLNYRFKHCL